MQRLEQKIREMEGNLDDEQRRLVENQKHHRRIESLNLETRTEIGRVVNENWDQLLKIAKDLVDARLEDGEKYCVVMFGCQSSYFYDYTIHTYNTYLNIIKPGL